MLINSRIIRASEEVRQLQADLLEIHSESRVELLLHFNRRGAERLAAHWARISAVPERDPTLLDKKAPPFQRLDACRALLLAERIDLVLQYSNDEKEEFMAAAGSLGVEVRHIDPDAVQGS
jgi:hypothetical protein